MKAANKGNPAIILRVENDRIERELAQRAREEDKIHFELPRPDRPPLIHRYRFFLIWSVWRAGIDWIREYPH